jgi:hypothetical protein
MFDEITSDQEKGFEILSRNLKRRFPFIIDVTPYKLTEYFIYININIEFFKFIKFYDITPNEYYLKYGAKGMKGYLESFGCMSYTFSLISDEYASDFGNSYNNKLNNLMNTLYNSIPKKYQVVRESPYSNEEETKDIQIQYFCVTLDESEETPALKDMLYSDYENARNFLSDRNQF